MSLTTCSILISQQPARVISVTRSLGRLLNLQPDRAVTIRLGSKAVTLPVRLLNRKGSFLMLPQSVASILRLPVSVKCSVKSDGREVQLGPLIGILTATGPDPKLPFGPRTGFIREILSAAGDRSVCFAFSPRNVNWEEEVVTGYFLVEGGRWVRRTVPLPDVVYNRLPSRTAEKTESMALFKERFVRRQIPLFNWGFFDKSDIYELLIPEKEAFRHVPESHTEPTAEQIRGMLQRHRFVYLKPTAGSLGFGIYRITYNPSSGYYARYRKNGSNILMRFPNFDGLMKFLRGQRLRFSHYVLQQGIRLVEIDDCPIDFRFHMTKNGSNEWVVSGIGAKKAGKGSVTTHIRTGGSLMTPEQVLNRVFGSRGGAVLSSAKAVAVRLAEAIERQNRHPLGELGFDLGIDQSEHVWMFEANAKPGRTIFKHPSLKAQGRASFDNIVEHCLYLSKFVDEEGS
ncbi:hypothetical protein J31TS4_15450 [Paenibacillus sp. J31TS4]|uniref:YheC/YheD family endospore coat-associated protein n=1 Tax=Paenibacillus sp. J31TS4 TaxID=2807195 RepID=UPI001B0BE734|nr:YheC/YheD family protein [Paenibacillus sp. J31TS4]GIP38265.1 hypothetical protein J31TS4_15450 [Paenibacillus sp. J31TS4]